MLILLQKLTTHFGDVSKPCSVSFLGSVKAAEVDRFMIEFYLRCKSRAFARTPYTTWQHSVRSRAVPFILLVRRFSQVCPAVVVPVAVYMVNRLRPCSGHHRPDDAMHKNLPAVDLSLYVSGIPRSCLPAGEIAVPSSLGISMLEMVQRARLPRQSSGKRIIRQSLMQIVCGWELLHIGVVP